MNAADGDRPKLSMTRPARIPLISGSLPGSDTGSMLPPTPGRVAGPGWRGPLFAQNGVLSSPARALAGGADLAGFFGADVQPASATDSASRPTQDVTRTVGTLAPGSKCRSDVLPPNTSRGPPSRQGRVPAAVRACAVRERSNSHRPVSFTIAVANCAGAAGRAGVTARSLRERLATRGASRPRVVLQPGRARAICRWPRP